MQPVFVWSDEQGLGRNLYVAFRKTFAIEGDVERAELNLFADTRYRLKVNGQTVCHGPARFTLSHPEFDTIDIAPYLRTGENVIAVLVNSYNCNSFHSDVSVGAMACWGEVTAGGKLTLLDPVNGWKCKVLDAFRTDTHPLSFALNPAEHLDARKLPDWESPTFDDSSWATVKRQGKRDNWGELLPRSIPMLDERAVLPRLRLGTFVARAQQDEAVASFAVETDSGEARARSTMIVGTWIHSPKAQQVTLGAWWGEYVLNGQKLTPVKRTDLALRQDFPAELKEGWNLLMVRETWGQNQWEMHLAYPKSAGLTLCAAREKSCADAFVLGGPWRDQAAQKALSLPLDEQAMGELPRELGTWRRISRETTASSPVRDRAWRTFERIADQTTELTCSGAAYAQRIGDDTLVLLYDFQAEVLGRMRLDFTAAEGTIVDVTWTERLLPDGVSNVHQRFFQDIAERYIAGGGRQTWHQMHPRGGRYVEVLVLGDLNSFTLHAVDMTRAAYPVKPTGRFECGDLLLNDIWMLGQRTQAACMEDSYLDCPMRERGLYAGDMLVQYMVNLAAFGDHALARRCIEIFLYRQSPTNGLVPGGAQGLPAGRHPDYSAILVQAIWQYYWHTGDAAWLKAVSGMMHNILRGLESMKVAGSDVLDGSNLHPYIDLQKMDRGGINCSLNCFYYQAFVDGANVFDRIGKKDLASHYRDSASRLAKAIRTEFWSEQQGVFTDRRTGDVENPTPSVAANSLAILYGIADEQQMQRAGAYLVDAMRRNFGVEHPTRNDDCRVTSYFSFYALGALQRLGRNWEIMEFIRTNWGYMLSQGAWTCTEYFVDTQDSRCHAWSAAPTHYLSRLLLGVSFPEAGNMNKVNIKPVVAGVEWAEGTYPHPLGAIEVKWRTIAGQLEIEALAPDGVEVVW